ncbi:MAG TPA: hypothetical protein VHX39_13085 [Acetobacteraceae bacterium]|nr:hypothetical protein [Acetobacteraceae bacterium]
MNKKPPGLPNIEDATLRACLAPLMDAMNAGSDAANQPLAPIALPPIAQLQSVGAGSNDNPLPPADQSGPRVGGTSAGMPNTLAEWRLVADDDFASFRMVELFLAMTDAELATAAKDFPRQIAGTVARIGRIKQRLAGQYDKVTATIALLERARLAVGSETE